MRRHKGKDRGFSRFRYAELQNFCWQYPGKKSLIAREENSDWLEDCRMIERCAVLAGGGVYYDALIKNVCYKIHYQKAAADCPTFDRSAYFKTRDLFFQLLNELKGQ